MKICYLDESGTGNEPYAIMVGIIVDIQRMHVTKNDWKTLLDDLGKIIGKKINEFHTRDFYRGNDCWRDLNGPIRAKIITAILNWFKARKHKISFCGLDKNKFLENLETDKYLNNLKSLWCMLGLHQILIIQKAFQNEDKNKGNTILIFDNEVTEKTKFAELILNPPTWTESYYNKRKKQDALDQIVDVPYYGDSKDVSLIQVADLIAYILRLYAELKENKTEPRYKDEKDKINDWVEIILKSSLDRSTRYPSRGRDISADLFYNYAPKSIREL